MSKAPDNFGAVNAAEMLEYAALLKSFFKLHGRDPRPEEFPALVADARALAAGDAVPRLVID